MSIGRVISMKHNQVKTPNAGTLVDLSTRVEYSFTRPSSTGLMTKWNVEKHDIVSFTVSGEKAIDVTLYRKHQKGLTTSLT